MSHGVLRGMVAVALCGVSAALPAAAEEPGRAIPTLLIKGEIVSVDHNDPSAPLLKVKDRYGFETPIYLTAETKISQGEQAVGAEALSTSAAVEVEYNFDINTAKRHAVSVKLSEPAGAAAAAPAAPPVADVPAPEMTEPAPMPEAAEDAPMDEPMSIDEPMPADEEAPAEAAE